MTSNEKINWLDEKVDDLRQTFHDGFDRMDKQADDLLEGVHRLDEAVKEMYDSKEGILDHLKECNKQLEGIIEKLDDGIIEKLDRRNEKLKDAVTKMEQLKEKGHDETQKDNA